MGSALMTPELVERAFRLVEPSLKHLLRQGDLASRSVMVVIVLDPLSQEELGMMICGDLPRQQWPTDYEVIARSKARLAYATSKDTGSIVMLEPQLLGKGDAKYQGGVFHHGIPVAASGIASYLDEMVATWVAATCRALCIREMQEVVVKDTERRFV